MKEYFKKLDELKARLDKYRPLKKEIVQNLREDLILRWTYNSNAIEGNTLTLNETKVALEGITVGGKSLRDHFEAINHKDVILKNIDNENAGKYRQNNVIISGASHLPPSSLEVPLKMQKFIFWYKNEAKNLHLIERASRVHVDFVGIHPFIDGNGRTSRLLMNLELIKDGFPAVVIEAKQRVAYYDALDKAHTYGDYEDFIKLVCDGLERSFERYFFVLENKNNTWDRMFDSLDNFSDDFVNFRD